MSDTRNAVVRIGQLNLRVSGREGDAGRRLANQVAHRLADKLPPGANRRLGALGVRVSSPAGAGEAETSDAIAGAIVSALRRGSRA